MEDAGKKRVEFPPYWVGFFRGGPSRSLISGQLTGMSSLVSELPHLVQLLEFTVFCLFLVAPCPLL